MNKIFRGIETISAPTPEEKLESECVTALINLAIRLQGKPLHLTSVAVNTNWKNKRPYTATEVVQITKELAEAVHEELNSQYEQPTA